MTKTIEKTVPVGIYHIMTDRCINCSLCAGIAPQVFAVNHHQGYGYIKKQPETKAECALAAEAAALCPVDAIKDNGGQV